MRKLKDTFNRLFKSAADRAVAGFIGLLIGAATFGAVAQGVIFIAQNGVPSGPSVYGIGDPTSGLYFAPGAAGFSRHVVAGATTTNNLPVLSTCGTSPTLAAGSTDRAGKITVGTSASNACTLTFGTTYTTAPFCIVQNSLTGAAANVYAVSATTIVWSSALADSTTLFYECIGVGSL